VSEYEETDDTGMPVELDEQTRAAAIIYAETRVRIGDLEEQARKLRDQILDYLGAHDASVAMVQGVKVLSGRRTQRPYFNTTKFKTDHPGLYEQYTSLSEGVPYLRISNAKKLIVP
jgi:hypothetical protein